MPQIELPTKKLQSAIKTVVDSIMTAVDAIKVTLTTVNTNVSSVKTDISTVNSNVNTVKSQTTAIQSSVSNLSTASKFNGTYKHPSLTATTSSEESGLVKSFSGKIYFSEVSIEIGSGYYGVTIRIDSSIYAIYAGGSPSRIVLKNLPVNSILSIKANYNYTGYVSVFTTEYVMY
ncbi:hypothetical protein ACQKND_04250 [Viridibacillus arvi]|uniref:hypothetical protein n=1 Tax=Viridibacillus arvi TaxID=263475 RepID=UPI003CFCFA26